MGIERNRYHPWSSTVSNEADVFTKNLAGLEHNKHAERLCGHDKCCSMMQDG